MKCYFCKAEIVLAARRFVPAQNRREKSTFRDVCKPCDTALILSEGNHVAKAVNGVSFIEQAPGRHGLVGLVVTKGWSERAKSKWRTAAANEYAYLVGIDGNGEGHFIMSDGVTVESVDMDTYGYILSDAKKAGLKPPFNVYAKYEIFQSPNVRFTKVTERAFAVV